MQPPSGKPSTLVRATQETPFHIDYSWFERSGEDLRREILSQLPHEQRTRITGEDDSQILDYIDPDSGEVFELDEIGMAIQEAAKDTSFINPHTSVIDSIFRVFLVNGNLALTPNQLAERIGRPAALILKTLNGGRVYKGIRPAL